MNDDLTPEQVVAIALDLLDKHQLTGRQYDSWLQTRICGLSFRDAADFMRREQLYDVGYWTVMMDSRYAHEIIHAAVLAYSQGTVRIGHTVASGSEAWFAPDPTLKAVTRRVRAIITKKKCPSSLAS